MRCLSKCLILIAAVSSAPTLVADELRRVQLQLQQMPLEYQLDGVVEARRQATLSAEVAGKIEAVFFDVDDFVKQGEVVLKIRDRDYRAQVEQARAAVDETSAGLQEMQLEFDRNQDLRRQKLISQAVFDRTKANLKAAEARKAAADASLDRAEEQLGYTVVRAPYSGVVVERHVEAGESTAPGQAIMTGYALGELRVSANVPQSLIGGLREHRAARVVMLEDGFSLPAETITIHPFANPTNHSFPIRVDLPPLERALYPGMLVKVAIRVGDTQRLLLPQQALVSRSEVNAVYVIAADGNLSLRQVRPGNRFDDMIEILAGLEAGEVIALDPVRAGIELKLQLEADR